MAVKTCDICGKNYTEESGKIKQINYLDKCYGCGGFEIVAKEVVVETVDEELLVADEIKY